MTKNKTMYEEFFDDDQVKLFLKFLIKRIQGVEEYRHSWSALSGVDKTGFERGYVWSCVSLYDAYVNYRWPATIDGSMTIYTYDESKKYLTDKQSCFSRLLSNADHGVSSDISSPLRVCVRDVLRWGGVENKRYIAARMKDESSDLYNDLIIAREFINSARQLTTSEFDTKYQDISQTLRLDSGTTKVYSLLCDSFIILDSRVGAALGQLVVDFCATQYGPDISNLSPFLKFSWGKGSLDRDGYKMRNPNPGQPNIFPIFDNGGSSRLLENLRTSWLLDRALNEAGESSDFISIPNDERLRALEAALFMIGYDLHYLDRPKNIKKKTGSKTGAKKSNVLSDARPIVAEGIEKKERPKDIQMRLMEKFSISKSHASNYYYQIKNTLG